MKKNKRDPNFEKILKKFVSLDIIKIKTIKGKEHIFLTEKGKKFLEFIEKERPLILEEKMAGSIAC